MAGTGGTKKGRQSAKHKGKYLRQWGITAKNKEKAWAKHLAKHPKDKEAAVAIRVAKDRLTRYKTS